MNPLGILEGPLRELLIFLHDKANFSYGWSIVVLTVIVRMIILPLFVSQYRSGRRMQQIAPQMKQLKDRYPNDKRKQQEEMMRLFQENKVNPFGSCAPILVQAPVFLALYFVLRDFSNEVLPKSPDQQLGFMWIFEDISEQFRDVGWKAIIIVFIYALSQVLATEVSMATTPQTSNSQRIIFRLLPLFVVVGLFLYPNVPAGLVLYWMTTNIWQCGQQVVLKRRFGPLEMLPVGGAPEPAPALKAKADTQSPKAKAKPKPGAARDELTAQVAGDEAKAAETPAKPRTPKGGGQPGQRRRPPKKR